MSDHAGSDDAQEFDDLEELGAEGDHTPVPFIGRRRLLTLGAVLALGAAIGIGLEQFEGDDNDDREGGGRAMRDAAARGFGPTPFLTPNASFFRIDTAYTLPQVDAATWSVSVGGMVDNPLTLTLAQLRAMPQVERTITLS